MNTELFEEYKLSTKTPIMCGRKSEIITKDNYIEWLEKELILYRDNYAIVLDSEGLKKEDYWYEGDEECVTK